MSRKIALLLLAAALGSGFATPGRTQDKAPVVVELFTSEGCSSCPPADALLGELAQRPDNRRARLPRRLLGLHRLEGSLRQPARDPAPARIRGPPSACHMVYTPQMVVDGRTDVVGSERGDVAAAIDKAAGAAEARGRHREGRFRLSRRDSRRRCRVRRRPRDRLARPVRQASGRPGSRAAKTVAAR